MENNMSQPTTFNPKQPGHLRKQDMQQKRLDMFRTYDRHLYDLKTIRHSFGNACRFADLFRCATAQLMFNMKQLDISPLDMPDGLWDYLVEHGKYPLNFATLEQRNQCGSNRFTIAITTRAEANIGYKTPYVGECVAFILSLYDNVNVTVLSVRPLAFGRIEVRMNVSFRDVQAEAKEKYTLDTISREDVEQYAAATNGKVELQPSVVRRVEPSEAPMTRETFESITISDMVTKRVHKRTAFLMEERLKIQGTVDELQKCLAVLDDKIANVAIDEMKALMAFLER